MFFEEQFLQKTENNYPKLIFIFSLIFNIIPWLYFATRKFSSFSKNMQNEKKLIQLRPKSKKNIDFHAKSICNFSNKYLLDIYVDQMTGLEVIKPCFHDTYCGKSNNLGK